MGIPGAGKSLVADEYAARGYVRLNRDERGGSAARARRRARRPSSSSGARRIVLDNTYLTRAARSHVIETANRHGLPARCVWLDTPLAQAQVNLVERMLDLFGALPTPDELRRLARRHPGVLAPTSQMRDVPRARASGGRRGLRRRGSRSRSRAVRPRTAGGRRRVRRGRGARAAPAGSSALAQGDLHAPHLLFDWSPGGTPEALAPDLARLAAAIDGPVQSVALCPHPGGPPTCWCRPPLPGLPLAFARAHSSTRRARS